MSWMKHQAGDSPSPLLGRGQGEGLDSACRDGLVVAARGSWASPTPSISNTMEIDGVGEAKLAVGDGKKTR